MSRDPRRRRPHREVQKRLLEAQHNLCLYCGLLLGSEITLLGNRCRLLLEWDHFVPFNVLKDNPDNNWVAACHVCNGIKGAKVYADLEQARVAIELRRRDLGYSPSDLPVVQLLPIQVPSPPLASLTPPKPVELISVPVKSILEAEKALQKAQRLHEKGSVAGAWFAVGQAMGILEYEWRWRPRAKAS